MALGAAVLGASGYTGGEVLRYLASHPAIAVVAAAGNRHAGMPVSAVHPHLAGDSLEIVTLEQALAHHADVVFSCLPSGELGGFARHVEGVLIDLSDEHRAHDEWVYGLPEFARGKLQGAQRIANPGCYPTAVLLGLLPFAADGFVREPVVVDALSGASGAGRKSDDAFSLASSTGSVRAYGTTEHRHVPEMERAVATFAGATMKVSFTPHLAPMARGLLATIRAKVDGASDEDVVGVLQEAYVSEPFVSVVADWPETKAVVGTNRALVHARVDRRAGWLVISVAIDNLGKGAAGQAIQNANLALGLEETTGLGAIGIWP